jgi:phosphatidylserine/phosphatidylglycerophosphate/cardiolipin synthase-like enzyme
MRKYALRAGIILGLLMGCSSKEGKSPPTVDASLDGLADDTLINDTVPADTNGGTEPTDLIVNEIMYAPKAVSDQHGEWIELVNRGKNAVNLQGWTLRDNSFDKHVISKSLVIQPEQYLVLGNNGDINKNGGYTAAYVYQDFQLKNSSGDSVQLVDPDGKVIDSVSYKVASPWPTKTWGSSIERISTEMSSTAPSSWTLAQAVYGIGDKGTPGMPNGAVVPTFEIDETIEDWQEQTLKASIKFSPDEHMEEHVLAQILAAEEQLRLAFFNIRTDEVLDALLVLMDAGVDVEVLLDKKQQDLEYNTMGAEMAAAGIQVTLVEKTQAEQSTMHHKFAVIDGKRIMLGSANYSWTAFHLSDEDLLTIENPDLATRLLNEFDEIKKGETNEESPPYLADEPIQIWVGPDDYPHYKLLDEIGAAQSHVLVAMFQFNLPALVNELIDAQKRGCSVVVLLDSKQAGLEEEKQAELKKTSAHADLADAGIPVFLVEKTESEFQEMHSKFVVIDHEHLVMGSYNWTALASFFNNETMVIIHDKHLAARAEGKFASILSTVSEANPKQLGLTTQPQSVTFEVDNVILDADTTIRIQSVGSGPFTPPISLNGTSLTMEFSPATAFEYRYQVMSPSGLITETGPSHFFTVPFSEGPFILHDVFRL